MKVISILISTVLWVTTTLSAADKPNIIFLLADDQRSGTLHLKGFGNSDTLTPTIDKLAESGAYFNNCYVFGSDRGSVCYPSRTQLLSGKCLFRYKELDLPSKNDQDFNLPYALRKAGYVTVRTGKANNVPYGINMEFNVNIERANRGSIAGNLGYFQDATDFINQKEIKGLADQKLTWDGEQPFFLYIAVGTPHSPFPAELEDQALFREDELQLPPSFMVKHPVLTQYEKVKPREYSEDDGRNLLKEYYASIKFMDRKLGELIELLKKKRVYENTIFIVGSDNGLSLGNHGVDGKSNLMEYGGMHVPLVVSGPGIENAKHRSLIYLLDLFPTICDFTGAAKPEKLDGESIKPILAGESEKVRKYLLTAYTEVEQRAIRDDRWKLLYFPDLDQYEFYDLESDSHELENLAESEENADVFARLKKQMDIQRAHFHDPYPEVARIKRVYNKNRIGPVLEI